MRRIALRAWRQRARTCSAARAAASVLGKDRCEAETRAAFDSWRKTARRLAAVRATGAAVRHSAGGYRQATLFGDWRAAYAERATAAAAKRLSQERRADAALLRSRLRYWFAYVTKARILMARGLMQKERCRRRATGSTLRAWAGVYTVRRHRAVWAVRCRDRAFRGWHVFTRRRQSLRAALVSLEARRDRRRCAHALRAWAEVIVFSEQRAQAAQSLAVWCLSRDWLSTSLAALRAWRKVTRFTRAFALLARIWPGESTVELWFSLRSSAP